MEGGVVAPFRDPVAVAAGSSRLLYVVDFHDRVLAIAPCASSRSWVTDGRGWRSSSRIAAASDWTSSTRARLGEVAEGQDACGDHASANDERPSARAEGNQQQPCGASAERAYAAMAGLRGISYSSGYVYASASYSHSIIRFDTELGCGEVIAGRPGSRGHADGKAVKTARFSAPGGIAVAEDGNALYVTDFLNDAVRRISPLNGKGQVTTVAGRPGIRGGVDGPGTKATFNGLRAVVASSSPPSGVLAELYVVESGYHLRQSNVLSAGFFSWDAGKRVRRVMVRRGSKNGVVTKVTTVAAAKSFVDPRGIVAAPSLGYEKDVLFVTDSQRGGIWRLIGDAPPALLLVRRAPTAKAPGTPRRASSPGRPATSAFRGAFILPRRTPLGGDSGALVLADTAGSQLLRVKLEVAATASAGDTLDAYPLVWGSRYVDASGSIRVAGRVAPEPRRDMSAAGTPLSLLILSLLTLVFVACVVCARTRILLRRKRNVT
ncbi:hypothetical protein NFJ02_12g08420 [Pycnococcus provasolii]